MSERPISRPVDSVHPGGRIRRTFNEVRTTTSELGRILPILVVTGITLRELSRMTLLKDDDAKQAERQAAREAAAAAARERKLAEDARKAQELADKLAEQEAMKRSTTKSAPRGAKNN